MKYWEQMGCRLLFKIPSTYVDTQQRAAVWRQRDPGVLESSFSLSGQAIYGKLTKMAHTRQLFSKVYPTLKYTYLRSQRELGEKSDI